MKKIINALFMTTIILTIVACNTQKKETEKEITGIILDASMNNIIIVSNGDTLNFSTMNTDKSEVNGIRIGDTATFIYLGEITDKDCITTATKLTIKQACNPIIGSWVKPIEGMDGFEGIKIEENGQASSINSATLLYESWAIDGENLILTGKSIGNGQTIPFSDTLTIKTIDNNCLILASPTYEIHYTKQK